MSTALSLRGEPEQLPSQDIAHAIAGTMEQLKAVRTFIKAEFQIGYKDGNGKIVPGTDAGLIPGCGDKPTLFLPGAQKATMYFNCFPTYKVQERDLGNGHVSIRVRCLLISRATRDQVGEGVGCCSTMEKKYRWRGNEKLCPTCGKPTIRKSKDKPEFYCWRKIDGCGATFGLKHPDILSQGDGSPVENTDLYDLHNTVLKMAKKRAHVDAAMTLACLSELFTQDIEDTFDAGQVREAARPYDGEVYDEPEPEPTPRHAPGKNNLHPNNSGFHNGQYAPEDQVRAYLGRLNERIEAVNAQWAEHWYNPDEKDWPNVKACQNPLVTKFGADGHLVKWLVETGQIDPDALPNVGKAASLGRYAAIVMHRSKAEAKAMAAELDSYLAKMFLDKKEAIYRKHTELAPDGWLENQEQPDDRGDAYEGPEAPEEALAN